MDKTRNTCCASIDSGEPLPVWAEVDLAAVAHNVREVRRVTVPAAQVMAVVKANAYGHGAIPVAKTALANGCTALGVARLLEAIELRAAEIDVPILIFGYSPVDSARHLIDHDLIQTVYSLETARAFSNAATKLGCKIKVHLKVDTGMGRLGLMATEILAGNKHMTAVLRDATAIAALPGLDLQGIFTHFAAADCADKQSAVAQFERFAYLLESLRRAGVETPTRHAANSAAIIDLPDTHLDMVRPGIILYGLYPSNEVDRSKIALKPAMHLKARVAHLKEVPAGFKVSYGSTYATQRPTRIATIPIGYADGYSRLLSSRGVMLVHGQRAPVVGRVCMDQTMIDVGHIHGLSVDDEVVIFGRQGEAAIHVDELAEAIGTINYEVVSTIMARVPRVYVH